MIQRIFKLKRPNYKQNFKGNYQKIDKKNIYARRIIADTHQRTWRKKSDGRYLFKLEESFYDLKTSLQGQKGNKHIT